MSLDRGGSIEVDRVSRTSARGVYAAGDCTGVLMLGLGGRDAGPDRDVARPRRRGRPAGPADRVVQRLHRPRDRHRRGQPAAGRRRRGAGPWRSAAAGAATRGPRCRACRDGFVKLFCRSRHRASSSAAWSSRPRASELIYPLAIAVLERLTVDQFAGVVHGLPVAVRLDRRGGPPPARSQRSTSSTRPEPDRPDGRAPVEAYARRPLSGRAPRVKRRADCTRPRSAPARYRFRRECGSGRGAGRSAAWPELGGPDGCRRHRQRDPRLPRADVGPRDADAVRGVRRLTDRPAALLGAVIPGLAPDRPGPAQRRPPGARRS